MTTRPLRQAGLGFLLLAPTPAIPALPSSLSISATRGETADEYFDYWNAPVQGRWKIYGLDLPADVLEKVYRGNAERLFARFRGGGPGEGREGAY